MALAWKEQGLERRCVRLPVGQRAMMQELPFDVEKLIAICRLQGVKRIGIFGSMARGDATEESDIDLLVELSPRISLLQFAALERRLSEALGRKVDLLTEDALSPYLRQQILDDVQILYEA